MQSLTTVQTYSGLSFIITQQISYTQFSQFSKLSNAFSQHYYFPYLNIYLFIYLFIYVLTVFSDN